VSCLQVAGANTTKTYSNVWDLSCGKSVIVIESTIYELDYVGDLEAREDEVLSMTLVECVFDDTPLGTACYK